LKSVDLRYQHQVIVNPDEASSASAQALAAVKKQTAAPVLSAGQGGKRAHSKTRTTKQQN
jgi:hypothetical protein